MTLESHDLHHEFPEMHEKIHEMKMKDNHFRRLFDDYHVLNQEVQLIEEGVRASSDENLETLKKKRLHLKDELFAMLKAA
ncbi:MAG: DUF465 domain-containing protein [Alphaproteobacteria bacterium]|nr:DUF465 domain-containing protein [Alphaproteobacteria bacterium]